MYDFIQLTLIKEEIFIYYELPFQPLEFIRVSGKSKAFLSCGQRVRFLQKALESALEVISVH